MFDDMPKELQLGDPKLARCRVNGDAMLDKALAIASRPDVIFCSFGDMLRVPGSEDDLFKIKGAGGDVGVVGR